MKTAINLTIQVLFAIVVSSIATVVWNQILIPITYFEPIEFYQMLILIVTLRTTLSEIRLTWR
jgi:hypothetical protein